ncbi:MAG TPA: rhomboid family intramembrane serine protease [Candidatus Altiarchaeales archaeon]|nr:rhomboid family intramembrane serine protease [Candidatus Altiarchaeales archaeon]
MYQYAYRKFRSRAIEYLIAVNAFMFFLTIALPARFTMEYLALIPSRIMSHPWTFLTSMFVHAGIWHIFFNMFALFLFGSYLERLTSTNSFIKTYFIGGFFAAIAYIATAPLLGTWNVPAVGASGAVFAVIGALVVLRPNMTIYVNLLFPMPLWVFAILYTIMALGSMGGGMGGVAENAHLGGLLAGIVLGYYFKRNEKPQAYVYQGYRYY